MGNRFQVNYEDMEKIAQIFESQAGDASTEVNKMIAAYNTVRDTWQGKGASAFIAEMEENVIPRSKQMIQAFEQAALTSKKIAERLKQAEEQAKSLYSF